MRVKGLVIALLVLGVTAACATTDRHPEGPREDRYAEFVWPPPPDEARIRLVDILSNRAELEGESAFQKTLIGATPGSRFDRLERPLGAGLDPQGRILVTDLALGAIIRFDRQNRRYDVLGTTGPLKLKAPLGLTVLEDGSMLVTDSFNLRVVFYDPTGNAVSAFGRQGDLMNPTDAEVSPDGKLIFVADSKSHQIVVFDRASGNVVNRIGTRGEGGGEFNFPTALAFHPDGTLFVVDQMNARVQILAQDGEFLDSFGSRGTRPGEFVRPKDIAIDTRGRIYVTDAAFNNVQIFDTDLRLLTFVGSGGNGPGAFQIAGGIGVRGGEFVIVDQLGKRVQLFRFLETGS